MARGDHIKCSQIEIGHQTWRFIDHLQCLTAQDSKAQCHPADILSCNFRAALSPANALTRCISCVVCWQSQEKVQANPPGNYPVSHTRRIRVALTITRILFANLDRRLAGRCQSFCHRRYAMIGALHIAAERLRVSHEDQVWHGSAESFRRMALEGIQPTLARTRENSQFRSLSGSKLKHRGERPGLLHTAMILRLASTNDATNNGQNCSAQLTRRSGRFVAKHLALMG